jgi:hypothetical protein
MLSFHTGIVGLNNDTGVLKKPQNQERTGRIIFDNLEGTFPYAFQPLRYFLLYCHLSTIISEFFSVYPGRSQKDQYPLTRLFFPKYLPKPDRRIPDDEKSVFYQPFGCRMGQLPSTAVRATSLFIHPLFAHPEF